MAAFDQGGDMRQTRVLGLNLVPPRQIFAQRAQFAHRQRQSFAFDLPRLTVRFGIQPLLSRLLPGMPGRADRCSKGLCSRVGIDHLTLRLRPQQGMVGMLAMDIQQKLGGFLQLCQRCGAAVDEAP